MLTLPRSLFLGLLVATTAARAASGGAPVTLAQSGFLLDEVDAPLDASVSLTFRVFDAATGGAAQWVGACGAVAVVNGYYAVTLGGASCAGTGGVGDAVLDTSDLPVDATRWLEVQVGPTTLEPRLALAPAPAAALAARALEADRLQGHAATDFATTVHGHAIAEVSGLQAALDGKLGTTAIGTLTTGKWCTANAGQVTCTADAPAAQGTTSQATAGVPSAAPCVPSSAGYLWYDTAASALKMCNGAAYVLVGTIAAPPGAPGGLAVSIGNASLVLSWNTVAGADSYEVGLQAGSVLGSGMTVVSAAGTGTTITGLTNGQAYVFAVRSVTGQWRSAWSATLQATPQPTWTCAASPTHAGCVSSSNYASCKAIRDDLTFAGSDGLYWIDPDGAPGVAPFQAWCDMTVDNGGWTTFFAGTNGTANVFARFELNAILCNNPQTQCLRRPPATVTTSTELAARCGSAMVKFTASAPVVAFLVNGAQNNWQPLNNPVSIAGGAIVANATSMWTGAGTNYAWIIAAQTPSQTFSSSYSPSVGWDYCNGVSNTSSEIKLYYR